MAENKYGLTTCVRSSQLGIRTRESSFLSLDVAAVDQVYVSGKFLFLKPCTVSNVKILASRSDAAMWK